MRRAILLALVAVLAAPAAAAQPPAFTQAFQVRIGQGDVPTTAAHEPPGWSVEERYTVTLAGGGGGAAQDVVLPAPPGAAVVAAACSCGNVTTEAAPGGITFHLPAAATGLATLTLATTLPASQVLGVSLDAPTSDIVAIVYVPKGLEARGPVAPTSPGASTDGQSTIQVFSGLPDPFWISVAPAAAAAPPPSAGFPWLYSGAAFVLGCIAWSLLVSRGLVQRRSRKQTAAVAAHVEASRSETPALLEGRKRALMAGLKELELARQANEIDVATYDQLKAELKRETVIVMRALDEAGRPTPS